MPAELSFTREGRLLISSEFDAVFKGKDYRVGTAEFLILAKKNDSQKSRIGMVIGKKTTKLAVNRNRIKRAIRESFRTSFPKNLHLDIVIVARPGINKYLKVNSVNLLNDLWQKLHKKISVST